MVASPGFTLGKLAEALGAALDGDASIVVTGVAPLDTAGPGDISFLTDLRYRDTATQSRAAAFLVGRDVGPLPGALLRCQNPQQALIDLVVIFHPPANVTGGIHPMAVVAPDAEVHPDAAVGPLAVVESRAILGARVRIHALAYVGPRVEIGEASVVHPHAVLAEGVTLGQRVIVHAGAVIGADGFGYAFDGRAHRKIPQVGTVVIEDDVEIGANTTIDRATFGATVIRRGTKIDNLVQVGHNVEVGEHSILISQVGISGSSRLGRGVVLAGQVGVADHVTIGDGVIVGAQSGVPSDIPAGEKMLGTPARPMTQAKRILLTEGHLPEIARKVRDLERRLARLEGRGGDAKPNDERTDG